MFTSDKKRQAQLIEKQKNEGVTGQYKRRYSFTLNQQHWMAPGYAVKNKIDGLFDCALERIQADGTQTWSIEIRDLVFDWNPQAIPEVYYLFAYPSRMDITIHKEGEVTGGSTWVNYQNRWNQTYKQEVAQRINDHERSQNLLRALAGNQNDDQLAMGMLNVNPLVTALCNMVKLNYNLNHSHEPPGEFGERFTGEIVKNDYFSTGIHLPLKTTWIHRNLKDNQHEEEWTHLGGLVKEKYQEYELRKVLRTITGNQNPDINLRVRFAELYMMERQTTDFLQIRYALLQTQTHIKDTWIKTEELELRTDENGITYGTE